MEVYMIAPRKVKYEAKKRENENIRFRSFLKAHADEKELDQQFLEIHNELFLNYDCNQCKNCCKMYHCLIPEEDIDRDASHLGMERKEFVGTFLNHDDRTFEFETKHKPCDFLKENGSCKLGECKPDSCKKYPYTDQPERLQSLYSVLDVVGICPVAFEIYERLKKVYGFGAK
jgi:Fe-S-cluster containining protein